MGERGHVNSAHQIMYFEAELNINFLPPTEPLQITTQRHHWLFGTQNLFR